MKAFRAPISPTQTPRKCAACSEAAEFAVYLPDNRGQADRSSRRFACPTHAGINPTTVTEAEHATSAQG